MRINPLRAMKAEGRPIINAWLSIGSAYAAETIAHQGFDAATIDCQHGMIGFETALSMFHALSSTPATPLVRPSRLDPAEIMHYLDAGSYGVICPMISTAADAAALVSACRYPPAGSRSFGPARGLLYGGADYRTGADEAIVVLAMIETVEGLDNLAAILAVPGLDGIYVGPNDLSLGMGFEPANEPEAGPVAVAIDNICQQTRAAGKIAGIFCSDGEAAARRVAEGFDFVTPGNDAALLRRIMTQEVKRARSERT